MLGLSLYLCPPCGIYDNICPGSKAHSFYCVHDIDVYLCKGAWVQVHSNIEYTTSLKSLELLSSPHCWSIQVARQMNLSPNNRLILVGSWGVLVGSLHMESWELVKSRQNRSTWREHATACVDKCLIQIQMQGKRLVHWYHLYPTLEHLRVVVIRQHETLVVLYCIPTMCVCVSPGKSTTGYTDLLHTPMFRQKLCHLTQLPKKNNKDPIKQEFKNIQKNQT